MAVVFVSGSSRTSKDHTQPWLMIIHLPTAQTHYVAAWDCGGSGVGLSGHCVGWERGVLEGNCLGGMVFAGCVLSETVLGNVALGRDLQEQATVKAI